MSNDLYDTDLPGIDLIVNAFLKQNLPDRPDLLHSNNNDGERLRRAIKMYAGTIIRHNNAQFIQEVKMRLGELLEEYLEKQ